MRGSTRQRRLLILQLDAVEEEPAALELLMALLM